MATGKSMIAIATGMAMILACALSSEAIAHTEKEPTSVTIAWDGTEFDGEVDSDSLKCVDNRKVRLFRRGKSSALASTRSDEEGSWTIGITRKNGDYYAKVSKLTLKKNDRHTHVCSPDKSARSDDALVRDCDDVVIFDGSGGDGSEDVDVDDDITVDVEGQRRYTDLDNFAQALTPFSIGPVSFGEDIHVVAINGQFAGPVGLDPLYVRCTRPGGTGTAALDAVGVPAGGDEPSGPFYNETYPMPTIILEP